MISPGALSHSSALPPPAAFAAVASVGHNALALDRSRDHRDQSLHPTGCPGTGCTPHSPLAWVASPDEPNRKPSFPS